MAVVNRFCGITKRKRSKKRRKKERKRGIPEDQQTPLTPIYQVGWGDGSRMNGFKGTSMGGPHKEILRAAKKANLPFFLTDESYSSIRSPCCHGHNMENSIELRIKLQGPLKKNDKRKARYQLLPKVQQNQGNGAEQHKIHGVRHCRNCHRTWNRDHGASKNIHRIIMDLVNGHERDAVFTNSWNPQTQTRTEDA